MPATTRYVAFLRAINVGGHIVKMTELKKIFERMGFGDVETFIASGNVVFASPIADTARLEQQIEKALRTALGYEVKTFVRSIAEVAALAAGRPFGNDDAGTLFVAFLASKPGAAVAAAVKKLSCDTDRLLVDGRELYWLRRGSFKESAFEPGDLEKAIAMPATLRNINTVRRLADKYAAAVSAASSPSRDRAARPPARRSAAPRRATRP